MKFSRTLRYFKGSTRIAFAVVLGIAALVFFRSSGRLPWIDKAPPPTELSASQGLPERDGMTAEAAYEQRLDKVWIQGRGVVQRVLPDDNEGSRHQRFVLRLPSRQTLLVAHNIDKASRVEGLREGDSIGFRGEFIWNSKGGLVHWTHRRTVANDAGWLEKAGRRYE